jgi:hypothetical protein
MHPAALDHGMDSEDFPDGLGQGLAPVQNHQQRLLWVQTPPKCRLAQLLAVP